MSVMTQLLTLADGRVVDVFLGGDPLGFPLVMHHGTPALAGPYQIHHGWLVGRWPPRVSVCRTASRPMHCGSHIGGRRALRGGRSGLPCGHGP